MGIEQNNFLDYKNISHKCLIRVQAVYDTLKKAEKRAVDCMLKKPDVISNASIVEAAEFAGCSEATYMRVVKKLGYSGFPELKASLLKRPDERVETLYGSFSGDDDAIAVVSKVFMTSVQTLQDTMSLLDPNQYNKALLYMLNAKKFVFVGSGDAYAVAYAAYLKFYRMGLNVYCNQDYDLQLIDVSKLAAGDVLFVVSHTGKTRSIYEIVKYAKQKDVRVITISNFPLSPIGKISDVILQTAVFTPDSLSEIVAKRIPELCILESLYINLSIELNNETIEHMRKIEENLTMNKL